MRVKVSYDNWNGWGFYVDVFHAGLWHAWNDEPITRRQARRLADFLREEPAA